MRGGGVEEKSVLPVITEKIEFVQPICSYSRFQLLFWDVGVLHAGRCYYI